MQAAPYTPAVSAQCLPSVDPISAHTAPHDSLLQVYPTAPTGVQSQPKPTTRTAKGCTTTPSLSPHKSHTQGKCVRGMSLCHANNGNLTRPLWLYGRSADCLAAMRSGLMPCRCVMAFKCNTQPVSHCLIKRQEMQRWPALGKPRVHQTQLTHRSNIQCCWLPATTHYHHHHDDPTPAAVVALSCSDILAQTH